MNNYAKRMNYQVSAAAAADLGTQRSKFYMPHTRKTTFNVGDLIPIGAPVPILPGDSIDDFDTKVLARLSTSKFPTMDNAFCDFFAFFVPWRLLFDKTREFFGENNESAWVNTDAVTLPSASFDNLPPSSFEYTLWDYFGLPIGAAEGGDTIWLNERFNLMPFRGYKLIYNEFFRNQNTTAPLMVNTTGTDELSQEYFEIQRGCRFHDYFSDCLPAPQKGPDVLIPGLASTPIITTASQRVSGTQAPMTVRSVNGSVPASLSALGVDPGNGAVGYSSSSTIGTLQGVYPSNLVLGSPTAATIRSLRDAFQIQRIYERDARSGTRYTEYLRAAFDVVSPDASLQRPQFLGTYRMALNMSQVIQNSASTDASPLGNVAGLSKTWAQFKFPAQGFTEHGYLYLLALARTERSYYGGIHPMFTQLSRFDVYDPALAMISEQPVYTRELAANGEFPYNQVFGYKPPWEELRSIPSWVTGSFRPDAAESLAAWTYVDYYGEDVPTLSTEWMEETDANMARTLAYNSDAQRDQILLDMRCDWKISRCVPIQGIPGLVDHF